MESNQIEASKLAVSAIKNCGSLMQFNTHQWQPEVSVPKLANEVQQSKSAKGKAIKIKINLANGFEGELRNVTRIMSRAYHEHMRMTIPWGANDRMLPNLQLMQYFTVMNAYKLELDAALLALLPKLPACITKAIALNGDVGNTAHYPTPQGIIDLYSFDFDPSPVASGFEGLPEGFGESFEIQYESKVREKLADGLGDVTDRITALLVKWKPVLAAEKPKFYQTTVDNISQLGETLSMMNGVANDPDVQLIVDGVMSATQYSADQLRDNVSSRLAVQATVDGLLSALCASIEPPAPVEQVPTVGTPATLTPDELDTYQHIEVKGEEEATPEPEQEEDPDPDGIASILSGFDL